MTLSASSDLHAAVTSALRRPLISLSETVAHLQGPFHRLRTWHGGGFDSATRFLVDAHVAGDPSATEALTQRCRLIRRNRLHETPSIASIDLEDAFFVARVAEYRAFQRSHYPWEVSGAAPQIVFHPKARTSDGSLLNGHLLPVLEKHGFRRVQAGKTWRVRTDIHSVAVDAEVDLQSLSPVTSPYLIVDRAQFCVGIGDLFVFSAPRFPRRSPGLLAQGLSALTQDLDVILPHALEIISAGILRLKDDRWLS